MVRGGSPTSSFQCRYLVVPTPLAKKAILSPLKHLDALLENKLTLTFHFWTLNSFLFFNKYLFGHCPKVGGCSFGQSWPTLCPHGLQHARLPSPPFAEMHVH